MGGDICIGRLVWMDVTDPQGSPAGEHAVVILTSNEEYAAGEPIIGVVVSSKLGKSAERAHEVMLPYSKSGRHPVTGFDKKCAAVCNWRVTVKESHINKFGGFIGKKYTDEIIKKSTDS